MALTKRQEQILDTLRIPHDISSLTDSQWLDADDKVTEELQLRGLSDDCLNEYGQDCDAILYALSQV